MIRISIVSDSIDRSDAMSASLEEDERFEIVDLPMADVILCLGISIRRIPRRGTPIVAVSSERDGDAPFDETLKAWLPAGAPLNEIVAALMAARQGLTVLTRTQAKRNFRANQPLMENLFEDEQLTHREMEVLQMLAAGLGNKQIAERLSISLNTTKFHVKQILAKLGATTRTEAVSMAIRKGLVPI